MGDEKAMSVGEAGRVLFGKDGKGAAAAGDALAGSADPEKARMGRLSVHVSEALRRFCEAEEAQGSDLYDLMAAFGNYSAMLLASMVDVAVPCDRADAVLCKILSGHHKAGHWFLDSFRSPRRHKSAAPSSRRVH